MSFGRLSLCILCILFFYTTSSFSQSVSPNLTLKDSKAQDQDDMCMWIHPDDASLSTIIASDKSANILFVYDLQGETVQLFSVSGKPGNIDIRYGFPLGGEKIDIVVFNDRLNFKIVILKVDPATRKLEKVDDGAINTSESYGMCLFQSPVSDKFYAFMTSKPGHIEQYELMSNGNKISGKQVRKWEFDSQTEGCVCDDETGQAYFGEEGEGIWKLGGEPNDATPGELIAKIGDDSGLAGDVEGVTIYYADNGEGYIIASGQGENKYTLLERKAPHKGAGEFKLSGVGKTDGIDVINVPLGSKYPQGVFAFHNGNKEPYPVGLARWDDIAQSVEGLNVDTGYWHPRQDDFNTSVTTRGKNIPTNPFLLRSYPNPFNPETTIEYRLEKSTHVKLTVSNLLGQTVRTLVNNPVGRGTHRVVWNGKDHSGRAVAGGTYLYRIENQGQVITKKLTLLK